MRVFVFICLIIEKLSSGFTEIRMKLTAKYGQCSPCDILTSIAPVSNVPIV